MGLIGLIVVGCKKEEIQSPKTEKTIKEMETNDDYEKRPSYGEIACIIKNEDGEAMWGKRCGTPNGKCGKETACKAIKVIKIEYLPNGMSPEEFKELWNNDDTRKILEKEGYHAVDVK